jgi:YD repeat-containing protein
MLMFLLVLCSANGAEIADWILREQADQPCRVEHGWGTVYRLEYGDQGRKTKRIKYNDQGLLLETTTFDYDADGRLVAQRRDVQGQRRVDELAYNSRGLLLYHDSAVDDAGKWQVRTKYFWDDQGRLESETVTSSVELDPFEVRYVYDDLGRLAYSETTVKRRMHRTAYRYDKKGRLVREGERKRYHYDKLGRLDRAGDVRFQYQCSDSK